MLSITSNIKDVTSSLIGRLKAVADPNGEVRDKMLRTIAFDTAANMKVRIHQDGKNSENTDIGEYSNSYIKIREKNRRGTDKKVILSLTRQMENDYGIVGGNGATGYALGFKNPDNANKAGWMEDKYGAIYKPTKVEVAHMRVVAEQFITDILNGETA